MAPCFLGHLGGFEGTLKNNFGILNRELWFTVMRLASIRRVGQTCPKGSSATPSDCPCLGLELALCSWRLRFHPPPPGGGGASPAAEPRGFAL